MNSRWNIFFLFFYSLSIWFLENTVIVHSLSGFTPAKHTVTFWDLFLYHNLSLPLTPAYRFFSLPAQLDHCSRLCCFYANILFQQVMFPLTFFLSPFCLCKSDPSSLCLSVCLCPRSSLPVALHGCATSVKPAVSLALTQDLFWCLSLPLCLYPLPLFKVLPFFLLQQLNLIEKYLHALKQFLFFVTCP